MDTIFAFQFNSDAMPEGRTQTPGEAMFSLNLLRSTHDWRHRANRRKSQSKIAKMIVSNWCAIQQDVFTENDE
jgi:hypothetical protein